jgi:hypothetical protein
MMDMNQTFAYAPIPRCKGKATDIAGGSVMSNTSLTGDWVALIGVDLSLAYCAFPQCLCFRSCDLFWQGLV